MHRMSSRDLARISFVSSMPAGYGVFHSDGLAVHSLSVRTWPRLVVLRVAAYTLCITIWKTA